MYKPEIINFFPSVDIVNTYSNENKLRHPGGIYNIGSLKLVNSLIKFIDTINLNAELDVIGEKFEMLIYDLFKFYDSCFEILACFCHGNRVLSDTDFIDRWITQGGYTCATDFRNRTRVEINILKHLYNKFKHTSNSIGFINLRNNNSITRGYYLLAFDINNGQVTSDDSIYPISFNREIRNIFYLIHKLSSELLNVLTIHIAQHNTQINFHPTETISTIPWQELYNRVNTLPNKFLKNEIGKNIYRPVINNDILGFSTEILTEQEWEAEFDGNLEVNVITSGDGYTTQFSFPHMGIPPIQG